MKGLILAAGLGTRLRPLTDECPKTLVKVNGKAIIEKQIENLLNNGVNDITVITGYKSEVLKDFLNSKFSEIKIIENKDFNNTNNMYSLYLAKDSLIENDFILMNGDVFFEELVVEKLLNEKCENAIAFESNNYNEESMKISFNEDKITHISKAINKNDAIGTSIDVYKFGREASKNLFSIIENIIINEKELNSWSEVAIDKLFDLERFVPVDIGNRWVEIDNLDDLRKAEDLFK